MRLLYVWFSLPTHIAVGSENRMCNMPDERKLMKKLRFLQSISGFGSPDRSPGGEFAFVPGDEVDIEKDLATAWVESGIAEFIEEKFEVPAEVEIDSPEVLETAVANGTPETATKNKRKGPKPTVEQDAPAEHVVEEVTVEAETPAEVEAETPAEVEAEAPAEAVTEPTAEPTQEEGSAQ
jgi:hypothetical protein